MNYQRNDKKSNPRASRLSRPGVVLALIVLGALGFASCGDDDEAGDPEAALNTYAEGINAHSVDEAMAAFAEEARMIDHPLNPGELNGKADVRRGVSATVNNARVGPDAYSISDVVVDRDTVSWSYVWNNGSEDFCAVGNEIDVNDDGLIEELRWGDDLGECNR
jgi:hypothetical protein